MLLAFDKSCLAIDIRYIHPVQIDAPASKYIIQTAIFILITEIVQKNSSSWIMKVAIYYALCVCSVLLCYIMLYNINVAKKKLYNKYPILSYT